MKFGHLKRELRPYYNNLFGWRTNRKIIVIESDDWGSIRMPSKEVYSRCLKAGYRVNENPYECYDSLASEEDLELLFDLLTSYKDTRGKYPVITANSLATNPDFKKIKNSDFQEYHYELITETLKRYPKHHKCFNLWEQGIYEGLFFPQSHGREHLNVSKYMNALRSADKDLLFGFENEMLGIISNESKKNRYVESLFFTDSEDKYEKLSIVAEGIKLFSSIFGYQSKSFIPTNYMWSPDFDNVLSKNGIIYYQGRRKMKEPDLDGGYRYHTYSIGQKNKYNQLYLIRNATFEPSLSIKNTNSVNECLRQISVAFKLKKPAIVSSHRVNYVGYIDQNNRDRNLKDFKSLLDQIINKWPQVEFLTSVQLGDLIMNDS